MIEKIVREFLKRQLDKEVYMEEQEHMLKEYVLIEKTGSSKENHIEKAVLAIQSYAESLQSAAELNERVKGAMEGIVELPSISKCELNTDYNYTDTKRKKYRYQAVFDIVHY